MTQKKQRDCQIRGIEVLEVTSCKTITVTRCGEWGRKHAIVVEEVTRITSTRQTSKVKRNEYDSSRDCILDFKKIVRDIKREYKNVMS